jgi:TetR/AcrR family transcriptional regulator, transcriptional repressor for nem operon
MVFSLIDYERNTYDRNTIRASERNGKQVIRRLGGMTRYGPGHKQATRQRLIDSAGRRFKADGLDGAGIATVVADVGLTNGAFYGHFASKDDLIASVVTQQLAEQSALVASLPIGQESVERFIGEYLSPAHRDDRAGGCPNAALLDEVGRCGVGIRDAYTAGVRDIITAIARHLDTGDHHDAQERAIVLFTLLVGALQTARAVTDLEFSDQILATARAHALAIAEPSAQPTHQARQDPS